MISAFIFSFVRFAQNKMLGKQATFAEESGTINRYTITTNIEVLKNLLSVRQSGYNVKIGENVIFITGFLYIS